MNSQYIRAFIAIELRAEIKNMISAIQKNLKKSNSDIKWVSSQNSHITLKFLGSVSYSAIEKKSSEIRKISRKLSKFKISLGSLGFFPKNKNPKIIWVDIALGKKTLEVIALDLNNSLKGFNQEQKTKSFHAHITLGRVRTEKNLPALLSLLNQAQKENYNACQIIDSIVLMKSTLKPSGPIYEIIKKFTIST